jgi:hypothetical protein
LDRTSDGADILLFSDSEDNNIVLGMVGDDIVFALYLDESDKTLWLTQYEAIEHPDGNDPDDTVAMGSVIFATIVDGDGDTATAAAAIQVSFQDDFPDAVDDDGPIGVAEDTPKVIDVQSNDVPGVDDVDYTDGTKVFLATDGSKGSAVYNNDGTFTYTPDLGAEGLDSFTYTITDGDGDTDTATVFVSIGEDSTPGVSATDALVDEDDLVPDGSDQTAEPAGDRIDEGSVTVDFFNDQPGDLTGAFTFDGSTDVGGGPNGEDIVYTVSGGGLILTASIGGVDIFTVTITGTTDNGGGNVDYDYEVELLNKMDHLIGDNGENTFVFTADFTVTDSDTDPISSSFEVTVVDDIPEDISPDPAVAGSDGIFPMIVTEDLDSFDNVGADKPGDVTFDPDLQGDQLFQDDLTTAVTSNGDDIFLDITNGGHTLTGWADSDEIAGLSEGDAKVFTIVLNPDAVDEGADEYTVTLFDKIDTGVDVLFSNFSDIDPGGPQDFIALDDPRTGADDLNQDVVFTANPISDQLNNSTQGSGVKNQQVDTGEVFILSQT